MNDQTREAPVNELFNYFIKQRQKFNKDVEESVKAKEISRELHFSLDRVPLNLPSKPEIEQKILQSEAVKNFIAKIKLGGSQEDVYKRFFPLPLEEAQANINDNVPGYVGKLKVNKCVLL